MRDPELDGKIILGVRSTGVYCRPSCPSRTVREKNIVLFNDWQEAEEAGFRPCKRCNPKGKSASEINRELAVSIRQYILAHLTEKMTLGRIAERFGKSPFQVQRIFKSVMGFTPGKYLDGCRLRRLKDNLQNGLSVTSAIYDSGYGSSSRVYGKNLNRLGMTPAQYKNGGMNMNIKFTTGKCQYGGIIVAETDHGICYVSLGDNEDELMRSIRDEYPNAILKRSQDNGNLESIIDYLNGHEQDLRFDLHGTDFQLAVWSAIRSIPFGETRSYSEVARMIGKPKAVRAVANACAVNPVPLIIPCHRVVRKNGDLGGYGLGIDRKRNILEEEKKMRGK